MGHVKRQVRGDRERRAWLLRQEGWSEARIAEDLEVAQSTVSRILARVEERLAAEFTEQAARIKGRQTATLEYIADQALRAWERSLEDAEEVTETGGRSVVRGRGDEAKVFELPGERTVKRTAQSGNPALLGQAREAYADIRAIWGLDAPKKMDVHNQGPFYKVYAFDPLDDGGEPETDGEADG